MRHTPEPKFSDPKQLEDYDIFQLAISCIKADMGQNPHASYTSWEYAIRRLQELQGGYTGLNPAGYRACVEALKRVEKYSKAWAPGGARLTFGEIGDIARQALALAEGRTP